LSKEHSLYITKSCVASAAWFLDNCLYKRLYSGKIFKSLKITVKTLFARVLVLGCLFHVQKESCW